MPSHNQLIQTALSRGVRAGTVLQDAMIKVRNARRANEFEFELALGEMFVLASDTFKERNKLRDDCESFVKECKKLQDEVEYWKNEYKYRKGKHK